MISKPYNNDWVENTKINKLLLLQLNGEVVYLAGHQ